MKLQKIHRTDLEGFRVSHEMINEQGQKTLREFIKGVASVEILSEGSLAFNRQSLSYRPDNRLRLTTGDWIMKDSTGIYQVVTDEKFEKNYSLNTQEK
ncbi:hypothetical protein ACFLTA_02480 [Bacteroidota bacterium]